MTWLQIVLTFLVGMGIAALFSMIVVGPLLLFFFALCNGDIRVIEAEKEGGG